MLDSSLCDHSDVHILGKETITFANTVVAYADANVTNKKVIFKVCASFTDSINEDENLDVIMPIQSNRAP